MTKPIVAGNYKEKLLDDASVSKSISVRLRSLRESTNDAGGHALTIGKLACLVDLHPDSIWLFEKARRGMAVVTLVRLKEALNCSWGDLLDGCKSQIVRNRAKYFAIGTGVNDGTVPAPTTSDIHTAKCEPRDAAEIKSILSVNVRRLRESVQLTDGLKMTVEHLSRLTALNHSSIWRFENGKCGMTVATLVRLKEAFGCEWGDLLDGCESQIVEERKKNLRHRAQEKMSLAAQIHRRLPITEFTE